MFSGKQGALLSEQGARTIVKVMVARGVQASGHVQNSLIQSWAVEAGLDDVLGDALVSAGILKWIDNGPLAGTITLTEAGYIAGKEE
jgi:hypothetical protein